MSIQLETDKIGHIQQRDGFIQGIIDCLPTLLGYVSIGIAFGVVGIASDLSVLEVALLALFVYAGSAQFIICALLVANTPISVIILTTFIVNLRHLLLSLTLAPYFTKYSLAKNIGIGILVTDETFGVASTRISNKGHLNDRWMNGLNLTAYFFWVLACIVGAILAQWIENPEALGLDFALPAMFAALLILQLQTVIPEKMFHYIKLIIYMVIAMIGLSYFMTTHMAVLISTLIVATIGVVTEK